MSLLRELLEEEGSKAVCEVLLEAASTNAKRTIDLNRFEVAVDRDNDRTATRAPSFPFNEASILQGA